MKITKGEIKDGRFEIPYRVYGDSAEKIFCICGAQQTMAIWRSFVTKFSKDYSVVVFDLPGHGRAKVLSGSPSATLDEQIEVVRKIVFETHGDKPMRLAAASWGSIIGAGFASKYPHLVEKLILGSFGGKPSKRMLDIIEKGQILFKESKAEQLGHLIIDNFGQRISSVYKKRIIQQFQQMDEEQFLGFYANADLIKNILDINKGIDLNKITAKTLIINGKLDKVIDFEDIEIASSQVPDCEVKIIPDAGHFLHHEDENILEIYHEFFSA